MRNVLTAFLACALTLVVTAAGVARPARRCPASISGARSWRRTFPHRRIWTGSSPACPGPAVPKS